MQDSSSFSDPSFICVCVCVCVFGRFRAARAYISEGKRTGHRRTKPNRTVMAVFFSNGRFRSRCRGNETALGFWNGGKKARAEGPSAIQSWQPLRNENTQPITASGKRKRTKERERKKKSAPSTAATCRRRLNKQNRRADLRIIVGFIPVLLVAESGGSSLSTFNIHQFLQSGRQNEEKNNISHQVGRPGRSSSSPPPRPPPPC